MSLKRSPPSTRQLFAAIALLACAGIMDAEEQSKPAEQFAAKVPPEWKVVYQLRRGEIMLAEFLPKDEEASDWRTMLSYEFHAIHPWVDPIEFMNDFSTNQAGLCEGYQSLEMKSGLENGFPTAVRMLVCPKMMESGKGRVTLLKVVQGTRGYYVAALTRRIDMFAPTDTPVEPAEVAAWSQFMRQIVVCIPGDTDHPCPSGGD